MFPPLLGSCRLSSCRSQRIFGGIAISPLAVRGEITTTVHGSSLPTVHVTSPPPSAAPSSTPPLTAHPSPPAAADSSPLAAPMSSPPAVAHFRDGTSSSQFPARSAMSCPRRHAFMSFNSSCLVLSCPWRLVWGRWLLWLWPRRSFPAAWLSRGGEGSGC